MFKLDRKNTVLVVMDMQEKLSEIMTEEMFDTVALNVGILTQAMSLMNMPIVESLQYPQGLGQRVEELDKMPEPAMIIEKTAFSLCKDNRFMEYLKEMKIKSVILTGMEAHICILQTALDLLESGYSVHIPADAVISANDFNWETGLDMAQSAGAVITVTETAIYQLLQTSEANEFKNIQKLLK